MTQLEVDSPFRADARTLLGLIVAILVGAVATAAGVGGGAIYIPLFNVLIGFALKPSTALSQACITAGSLAAVASNLPRTHPAVPDAPLIDFPLMLLLTPLLLVGVGIGVLLNVTLPSWLLNILLLVLLLLLLVQAVAKGKALWAQESRRAQAAAEAAARHDADADAEEEDIGAGGRALLGADYQGSAHAPPGLRRRAVSYAGPRGPQGPLGLEPEQDVSLGCLEGLDGDVKAVVSYDAAAGGVAGSSRRRAASVSWDCMEGAADAGAAAAVDDYDDDEDEQDGAVTPTRGGRPLPPSAFATAAIRPPSSTGAEMGAAAAATAAGALRSGPGGGGAASSSGPLSPASSLKYAPSWRAFNELGALDFETDSDGESGVGGGGAAAAEGPYGRASARRLGFGSAASSPALPPSARLLSQLLRRPLPPQLQLSPSVTRGPGAAERRGLSLPRRTSFDQTTGADLAAAAAAAADQSAAGAGTDSWLQRRSKWRSRFPPGALPHRGASRPAPRGYPYPSAVPSPSPTPGQQQQPSSGASARTSGSGIARFRSRSLRSGDSGGGGGGGEDRGDGDGAGLDQPLLGSQVEFSDRGGESMIPDPKSECHGGGGGGGAPAPAGPAVAAGSEYGGVASGLGSADESYRPPTRLETLHEEIEDRLDLRSKQPNAAGSSRSRLLPPAAAGAAQSAPALRSPFASAPATAYAAAAATPRIPALPPSRPACDMEPAGPAAYALGGRGSTADADAGAAASAGPAFYLQIEDAPAASAATGTRGRPRGGANRAGAAVKAAMSEWAAPWGAAARRIPRRFVLGLVVAWLLYLVLQAVRAFQPYCSPAWWALFVVQTVAMLSVSVWALLMAAAALSKHAAAAEAATAGGGGGGGGITGAAAAVAPVDAGEAVKVDVTPPPPEPAAAAVEPAMSGTAALLVLQAPLATLAATFGAGLTGGLLGLGGGMVMGPLLLAIGVHPQVTAASSGAMVLFSSSAALIQFALLHRLNTHYALVFGAASLVAGLVGTKAVARAIKRSGRPSIVVLALAGVMALGTVCVAAFGMRQAAAQLSSGKLGFVGLCNSAGGKW